MVSVDLAHHTSIKTWKPTVGDIVIWHGWLQHWFGVVSDVGPNEVTIIKKGMPQLLFSLSQDEYDSNKEIIPISRIKNSTFWGGLYAVQKASQGNIIWYV